MSSELKLLNVGCGRCYHDDWTNIDLEAAGPGVRQYDLRRGLPYPDHSFDAVYHSHVLEHLTPQDAVSMITECRRVLRPGGVLRVVVPDLEGIARNYLNALSVAAKRSSTESESDADSQSDESQQVFANHRWMVLEMIDQLTRHRGGGEMGRAINDPDLINPEFVVSRMGQQMFGNDNRSDGRVKPKKSVGMRLRQLLRGTRKQLALIAVTLIEGSAGRAAYREGLFRQSGEVHRWMYDRVSLAKLLGDLGFHQATVCGAGESSIADFDQFQLDRDGKLARKPDSLYMEAIKQTDAAAGFNQTAVGSVGADSESLKRAA